LSVQFKSDSLSRLHRISQLTIKGTLSQGGFYSIFPLKPGTESHLNLTLDKVELTGLEAIGVQKDILSLGTVSLEGRGKGNSFRIHELKATGGNLEISGEGSFLLANPFEKSRFNLQLVLQPGGGFDDKLNDLLNLFAKPGQNGSYLLRVNGTLANPRSF
jgi:type II secretion system protein N